MGSSGKSLLEKADIQERWRKYTEDLYNKYPWICDCYIEEKFTLVPSIMLEVQKALKKIRGHKAPGSDGIPCELHKASESAVHTILTSLCQRFFKLAYGQWIGKEPPKYQFKKRSDAMVCSNNRTIALISHANKVMLKVIQSRMEQNVECQLSDVQAGFRWKRGVGI